MPQDLDERPLLVRLKARIDKNVGATTKPIATDIALHQQSADEIAKLELELKKAKNLIKEMDLLFGRNLLAMRCAVIEWDRGAGAKAGMSWIYNTLRGPGELPPQDAIGAQAYFDKQIIAIEQGLDEVHAAREELRPKPLNPA